MSGMLKVFDGSVWQNIGLVDPSSGGSLPYKVYTASLTQTSTDPPVANIFENTIGTITWSYNSGGYYIGTCTDCFTTDKTTVNLMVNYNWDGCADNFVTIQSNDAISLQICAGDDFLATGTEAFIEIRVYP